MTCRLCAPEDPLRRIGPWSVVPGARLDGVKHHLLLVPDAHVPDLLDLVPSTLALFWEALQWAGDAYDIGAYGLLVNPGGGHVYAQVIVGDATRSVHVEIGNKEHANG